MKIEELFKEKIYYFSYNSPEYSTYNYIGKYKGDKIFSLFLQPIEKYFYGDCWQPGWGDGVYRLATLEEINHLEQCELAGKYVEYKKTIKTKYEKEENTMKSIESILEKIYEDKDLRNTCIPLFIGNPGLGKTKVIEKFARDKGVQLIELIASQLMPHEISGISIPNQETKMMSYFDFDRFCNLKDGDILFFDELLNANPMVLNACLTLLENRKMISGRPLPKIMIVAAANQQGATMLTPQIKERFIFYNVEFSVSLWAKYMYGKYNMVDAVLDELVKLIKNEKFENSRSNYYTPRSIDKAISMIIRGVKTPYEKELTPLLNIMIENTTDFDLEMKDGEKWLKNEKISWLKVARETLKTKKEPELMESY